MNSLFPAEPTTRGIAQELYTSISDFPIISPHGHVDPKFLLENKPFENASQLFIYQDHYVTRILHSQGGDLEILRGAKPSDGEEAWRIFASGWHYLLGTNSGYWIKNELATLFDIHEVPSPKNASKLFDSINARLASPDFLPQNLFNRFKISFLATTDDPIDSLVHHQDLAKSGALTGKVVPTFRPDKYLDPRAANWKSDVKALLALCNKSATYSNYILALEERRAFFKSHGAVSTDHSMLVPYTTFLKESEASRIFDASITGSISVEDGKQFLGHMISEMARMSCDDGLVMTLHPGVIRNHHEDTFKKYGPDSGHDFPTTSEFMHNIRPLLAAYGNHPNFQLILFTLDESTWGREIAPLASFYRSVYIGVPWWFLDAPEAMLRFRSATTEVAGFYKGSGFIDDTRAFLSIPARHDAARRVDSSYLAKLVSEESLSMEQAMTIARDLVTTIPQRAFKL